jgi:hypothetical protein
VTDTRVNRLLFINYDLAVLLCKHFSIPTILLGRSCLVQGYDGRETTPITHAMIMTLIIDGHCQPNTPFLIVPLGKHDMILGKK